MHALEAINVSVGAEELSSNVARQTLRFQQEAQLHTESGEERHSSCLHHAIDKILQALPTEEITGATQKAQASKLIMGSAECFMEPRRGGHYWWKLPD